MSRVVKRLWLVTLGTTGSLISASTEEYARRAWARQNKERLRRLGLNHKRHGVELVVRLATEREVRAFQQARVERMDRREEQAS